VRIRREKGSRREGEKEVRSLRWRKERNEIMLKKLPPAGIEVRNTGRVRESVYHVFTPQINPKRLLKGRGETEL